jgi:diadenosine tetraphosphate (Ap4A) HIT family hydrolase
VSQAPVNDTMIKFGYPATLVAEYERWIVLLRPRQATLGALVLACREPVTAFAQVSPAAFAELGRAVADAEAALRRAFQYDKINYLMLMMVDPDVHFHVLPRYAGPREFAGVTFADPGWPRLPDLSSSAALSEAGLSQLLDRVKAVWRRRAA